MDKKEKAIAFLFMAVFLVMVVYFISTIYHHSGDKGEIVRKNNRSKEKNAKTRKRVNHIGKSDTSKIMVSKFIAIYNAPQCIKTLKISMAALLQTLWMYETFRENCRLQNFDCGKCNKRYSKGFLISDFPCFM